MRLIDFCRHVNISAGRCQGAVLLHVDSCLGIKIEKASGHLIAQLITDYGRNIIADIKCYIIILGDQVDI